MEHQTFTLTAGADTRTGGAGDDVFDGAVNSVGGTVQTLQGFDQINGGAVNDTVVLNRGANMVADAEFNGVTSVERVITTNGVTLGSIAQRAGINEVITNGGTLTIGAGYTTDTVKFTGAANGIDQVVVDNGAANTNYRVTFTSAEAGNGSQVDSGAVTGQDGGLAVRFQREDGADALVGGVSRFEDEGLALSSTVAGVVFDVRDISGTARGNFAGVVLDTQGADEVNNAAGAAFGIAQNAAIYINAGSGNDALTSGNGNDFLVGGAGDDTIVTGNGANSVIGGAGNDAITGGTGNDSLNAGDGNDSITAAAGIDNVDAGAGDDAVVMANNLTVEDTVAGGDGRDTLAVTDTATDTATIAARASGFEVLRADVALTLRADRVAGVTELQSNVAGAVVFTNLSATQTLRMTEVADNALTATLTTNTTADAGSLALGATTATGTDGTAATTVTLADYETLAISSSGGTAAAVNSIAALTAATLASATVTGTRQLTITAFTGSDLLRSVDASAATGAFIMGAALPNASAHTLIGGSGNDTLRGGGSADTITANEGNNSVVGGAGGDVITSGGGNDTIQGGDGNDNITSGAGNDSVSGDAGNDTISTGDGADTVDGAVGSDNINTGAGDDRITIAAWADITVADTINGGDGTDTIVAAAGAVTLNSAATGGLQNLEAVALAEAAGQTVRSPMPALVRSTTPSPSRLSRLRPTSSTPAACCPPRHA